MKLGKRFLALATAGAAALLLGGSLGVLRQATPTLAANPTTGAVGCANSVDPTTINFTTGAGGLLTSQTQNPSAAAGIAPATLNLATPLGVVLCGVVVQDADIAPNDVQGGSFTATVTGPTSITESNAARYSWNCGSVADNSCTGAVPNAAGTLVSPLPGNTFHVGFLPGASFGVIGTATPTIAVSVTWTSAVGAPPATFTTPTALIGVTLPVYFLFLTPNPATIPANLPTSTNVVGSTITAAMYHAGTTCIPIVTGSTTLVCAGPGAPAGTTIFGGTAVLVPGSESGTITWTTNLGVFSGSVASPSGPTIFGVTGANQTVSEHCGGVPAQAPTILVPTLGFNVGLTLTSCLTVSVTLIGGGEAGTASVVAVFIGDFTGSSVNASTTVNLTPGPITGPLTTGCNEVITPALLAAGANGAAVIALISGFNVSSIWVFNNATHTFQALYFSTAGAPTDLFSVGPGQSIFICGTGAGTFRLA